MYFLGFWLNILHEKKCSSVRNLFWLKLRRQLVGIWSFKVAKHIALSFSSSISIFECLVSRSNFAWRSTSILYLSSAAFSSAKNAWSLSANVFLYHWWSSSSSLMCLAFSSSSDFLKWAFSYARLLSKWAISFLCFSCSLFICCAWLFTEASYLSYCYLWSFLNYSFYYSN